MRTPQFNRDHFMCEWRCGPLPWCMLLLTVKRPLFFVRLFAVVCCCFLLFAVVCCCLLLSAVSATSRLRQSRTFDFKCLILLLRSSVRSTRVGQELRSLHARRCWKWLYEPAAETHSRGCESLYL